MSDPAPGYLRRLRLWDAALIVIGGIIGGGIFLNPYIAAQRTDSGTTLLLMWVGAGVLTLVGALCYAELGARRPHAGGSYVYLREASGYACVDQNPPFRNSARLATSSVPMPALGV